MKKLNQLQALKAIAASREPKPEPVACQWCIAVQGGDLTSRAIPTNTAPMCLEHAALSVEWSRRMRKLDANGNPVEGSMVDEMTVRGIEIARRQMVLAA